jgi:osmotically-inducible protein OsmY
MMWRRDQMMQSRGSHAAQRFSASQRSRMEWRAAGAQFYPGGAYEQLSQLSQRGRGPKGYTRTDDLLKEIICEQLTDDPFIDASDVTLDVANSEVTLRGTVPDRRQKYAIEDLVADVAGVNEIHNHIGVADNHFDDAE